MERYSGSKAFFIRDGEITAAFDPASLTVSTLIGDTSSLEDLHRELTSAPTDPAENGPVLERRQAILPFLFGPSAWAAERQPSLGRLTINISNACNLVCEYCYADHGLYHSARSLMPPRTAAALVERVVELYGDIELVQFFGGEPLMNVATIDAIGEAFTEAVAQGRLSRLPKFVATTNGTLSGERVLKTLRRWDIALTVSWDGPDEVHDRVRPTASGKSSGRLLRRSLERFGENQISFTIESTYNRAHVDAGVSVVDLMQFYWEATGERSLHIAPAFLPPKNTDAGLASGIFDNHGDWQSWAVPTEELIPLFREASRVSVVNFLKGSGPLLGFAGGILEQLIEKRPSKSYCPAFFSQLSLTADGSVFPCFMFIGDNNFRLGNLFTDEFPNADSRRIFARYFDEFGEGGLGSTAWYAPLSGGCIAGDAIATGSFGRRAMAPLFEAMAEECILGLARYATSLEAFGPVTTVEKENENV